MDDILPSDVISHDGSLETGVEDQAWVDLLRWVNKWQFRCDTDDEDRRYGRILLAAHVATLVKKASTGAAGPVISSSVGGVRRTYAQMASSDGLKLTKHGQAFDLLLIAECGGPTLV